MSKLNRSVKTAVLTTMALVGLSAANASAATVLATFDNYNDGEVVGQPSGTGTKWTGSSGNLAVVPLAGSATNKVLTTTTTAANSSSNFFLPTAAELGGNFSVDKLQSFSFDARRGGTDATGLLLRVYIGASASTHAIEFDAYGDGDIGLNGGRFTSPTLDNLLSDNAFHTFYGTINFATATYNISTDISGVPTALATNMIFDGGAPTNYAGFSTNIRTNNSAVSPSSATNSYALDNLSLSVPEPTLLGVAGLGAMALLRRRVK